MSPRPPRFTLLQLFLFVAAVAATAHAAQAPDQPARAHVPAPIARTLVTRTLVIGGLGKGTAPLDGPWQFHPGDDPAWASPGFDDSQWEQLTADKPWGTQGHEGYTGFAWYRRAISITPAPGASPDVALLIPGIDGIYELYWNGVEVAHNGSMPPHVHLVEGPVIQTYGLGPVRTGVLAVRVWRFPLGSNEDGTVGGFTAAPIIGSPEAIAAVKGNLDFQWLRRRQFQFGLTSLYTLVAMLSLMAWLRDRRQWLLFWMTVFAFSPLVEVFFRGLQVPFSSAFLNFVTQTEIQIREASQWFLLLWLLQLHNYRGLVRLTRVAALICVVVGISDGLLPYLYSTPLGDTQFQIVDGVFTIPLVVSEVIPAILVAIAIVRRQRLDSARWVVAIFAFLNAMLYAVINVADQGVRFTHWTLAERMRAPLFSLNGNPFNLSTTVRTLLFLSIIYAVIRYTIAERRRQTALEQEFQNARELQQVLVPEDLPTLPGFTLTSAYRPASEVGGDFFQIIPLGNGSTLVVLGDVSGKGLKAAMAVSLIVGAVRTLAETISSPAQILAGLNRRLANRLQGGFATAIALRLDRDGACTMASAGHPAPFLNERELSFPGALPLGLAPSAAFEEIHLQLGERDHLALYTDGLLEARSQTGELYSFDRLKSLFATKPTAEQAAQAAVNFGQDDDITVLTLTRVEASEESTAPQVDAILAPA